MFAMDSLSNNEMISEKQKKYIHDCQFEKLNDVEKFDLSIYADDSGKSIIFKNSYAQSLFHKETICRLISHYIYLLGQLAESPNKPYFKHSLINETEYDQLIHKWNATNRYYSKNKTIHLLFEEQVKRTPDNTAVIYEDQTLSYRELNEKSNQLARHIRKQ